MATDMYIIRDLISAVRPKGCTGGSCDNIPSKSICRVNDPEQIIFPVCDICCRRMTQSGKWITLIR